MGKDRSSEAVKCNFDWRETTHPLIASSRSKSLRFKGTVTALYLVKVNSIKSKWVFTEICAPLPSSNVSLHYNIYADCASHAFKIVYFPSSTIRKCHLNSEVLNKLFQVYNGRQWVTVLVNGQARTKGTEMLQIYQIYLVGRKRETQWGLEPNNNSL